MRKLLYALSVAAATLGYARLPDAEAAQYVAAIYRAEGGAKAKVPYGILSVRVATLEDARRICFNTVQRSHDRWLKAGSPGEFVDFLADRYCPAASDAVGNRNWKKNVKKLLGGVK